MTAKSVRDNLIIDVGMHVGHDTSFYLAKGFDVVAVEANPELVRKAETRFASEIATGPLRIFGVAIAERPRRSLVRGRGPGRVEYCDPGRDRARGGARCFAFVTSPCQRFAFDDILREVGIPHYLKVDIQGTELLCAQGATRL